MLIPIDPAYMEPIEQNSELDKALGKSAETAKTGSYCSLKPTRNNLPTPSPASSLTQFAGKHSDKSDDEESSVSEGDIDGEGDGIGDGDGEGDGDGDVENELDVMSLDRRSLAAKRLLKYGGRRITPKSHKIGEKLKEELTKYKQELKEYNETTKELEEKYMKINCELNEMQQKHDQFVAARTHNTDAESEGEGDGDGEAGRYYTSSTSIASNVSANRSKVFSRSSSFMTVLEAQSSCNEIGQRELKYSPNAGGGGGGGKQSKSKSCLSGQVHSAYSQNIVESLSNRQAQRRKRPEESKEPPALKDVYNVLKDVINTTQDHKHKHERERGSGELNLLYSAIKSLKSEQMQYRNIIRQQQDRIADYHTRCVKAQEVMKTQKHEIDKLNVNNKQLETSIYHDFDDLRSKIDAKLKSISHLPQLMRDEHSKCEKFMRENCLLMEKLHHLQEEATQLKTKIDDLGKRKLVTLNRLKAAERDLKIFKNYNAALKSEKRRMAEELATMKEQLAMLQATNKRQLTRHRDQSEKQRRDLQKRIFDLELKLSRSQNSTASLIQERDSLIAELQAQLHTLVHNFEVSQKHIRVLRRHIYSMTTSGNMAGGSGGGGGGSSAAALNAGISQRSSEAGAMRLGQLAAGSSTSRLSNPRTLKSKA